MKIFCALFIFFILLFLSSPAFGYEAGLPPQRIVIPSINLSLPVNTAEIKNGTWEVYKNSVSYGIKTAYPGHKGNTIIFSHALPKLFGNLTNVKNNESIHIFTKNNWFEYVVKETKIVEPSSTDILDSNNESELTLFTCVGQNFEYRFIVKAQLKAN